MQSYTIYHHPYNLLYYNKVKKEKASLEAI